MPSPPRDYAREYARRVEIEQARAVRESRPFELGRARGHAVPYTEKARTRLRYWTRKTMANPDTVRDAVQKLGLDSTVDMLRHRYANTIDFQARVASGQSYQDAGAASIGRPYFDDNVRRVKPRKGRPYFRVKEFDLDIWWFYYHSFSGWL